MYNVDTNEVEELKFHRMGFIDQYNNTMGDVDSADQLKGSNRFDICVRNRKWWWSIVVLDLITRCGIYLDQDFLSHNLVEHYLGSLSSPFSMETSFAFDSPRSLL